MKGTVVSYTCSIESLTFQFEKDSTGYHLPHIKEATLKEFLLSGCNHLDLTLNPEMPWATPAFSKHNNNKVYIISNFTCHSTGTHHNLLGCQPSLFQTQTFHIKDISTCRKICNLINLGHKIANLYDPKL